MFLLHKMACPGYKIFTWCWYGPVSFTSTSASHELLEITNIMPNNSAAYSFPRQTCLSSRCLATAWERLSLTVTYVIGDTDFRYLDTEQCRYTHTHTHILAHYKRYPGIFYQTNAHTPIHIYIYIVICVPSLVEIAPGVPELCLSGVIYDQFLQWPETQKFRFFTVMWRRT
jgi:hypothetical protein